VGGISLVGGLRQTSLVQFFPSSKGFYMDTSKVIWESTLTEKMVSVLSDEEIETLIAALDEAVEIACSEYDILYTPDGE
jgi:hypothetical protein